MPTTVRLLIYQTDTLEKMSVTLGRSQPDGIKRWGPCACCSICAITLVRGGWVRSLWKAWKER